MKKILHTDEEILWSGKPHDDSFMVSCFPIVSLLWLGVSATFMYEYFTALAPAKASNLLHGVMLTVLVTLPTWVGIGVFFARVYERKISILYAITNQRVIKQFGLFKPQYQSTDWGVIQSINYQNGGIIHSTFKTASITLGLGHYEYNGGDFLTSLDYLENAESVYKLLKFVSIKQKKKFKFLNDPHPGDLELEIAKEAEEKKKAA